MASKSLRVGSDDDRDQQSNEKRMKRLPSFGTVLKESMTANSFQNLLVMFEPMLRQVVQEETQRGLAQWTRSLSNNSRTHPMQIQQAPQKTNLKLIFPTRPMLPIFTSGKIEGEDSTPLRILLVNTSEKQDDLIPLPSSSIKLEIVVVDGDFSPEEYWSAAEFDKSIVKERAGKRPLLTGDVSVTMKDGLATIDEISITDNSSWIRSRHFRIGARVIPESCGGIRIREAFTEKFVVKDHRGEHYKKSYPPALSDKVWRLERIAKEGVFHKKLASSGIETVQDFLRLWTVNQTKLREILGGGMSEKIWETTISHARTCVLGNKHYIHSKDGTTITLNSICEIVSIHINGVEYPAHALFRNQMDHVNKMLLEAYNQWWMLEEVDAGFGCLPINNVLHNYPNGDFSICEI